MQVEAYKGVFYLIKQSSAVPDNKYSSGVDSEDERGLVCWLLLFK